jgi:hypothetical protein
MRFVNNRFIFAIAFVFVFAYLAKADSLASLARIVHDKVPISIDPKLKTVTFPLMLGKTKAKHNIWFVITDCSDLGIL